MAAMQGSYHPDDDRDENLRDQRVAAYRLFLCADVAIAPTASTQIMNTPNQEKRKALDKLVSIHFLEPQIPEELLNRTRARAADLVQYHSDERDCLIVAEAEILGFDAVVTFDRKMRRRLAERARVAILSPIEALDRIGIVKKSPRKRPAQGNPNSQETWWRE